MREKLESLKNYQDVLIRIVELKRSLDSVPEEVSSLKAEWDGIKERLNEFESKQEHLRQEIKDKKLALEEASSRSQKYEKDLHSVTNSREYNAVLKEIDTVKKLLANLNESIDHRKTDLTEISRQIEECTQLENESREQYETALAAYQAGQSENRQELKEKDNLQTTLSKRVPPAILRKFEQIAQRRNGIGLALCSSGICMACYVRVRPNVVDALRRFDRLIICEHCKRILFFNDSE